LVESIVVDPHRPHAVLVEIARSDDDPVFVLDAHDPAVGMAAILAAIIEPARAHGVGLFIVVAAVGESLSRAHLVICAAIGLGGMAASTAVSLGCTGVAAATAVGLGSVGVTASASIHLGSLSAALASTVATAAVGEGGRSDRQRGRAGG
jgi:hypothetical protein